MKRKWFSAVLALSCAVSLIFGAVGAKAEVIHETDLEDYILSQMSSAHVLGMSISIVSADKELYCAAYGTAGKTTKDYVLGDLSKSFTAAAIMRLVDDGELRLEDPVGDYLPEYKNIADVTIGELLHHTSGITKYEVMSDIQAKGKKGTFEYSNANYNLLGKIIEAKTGTGYTEYISDNILDPLEMESTYSLGNISGFEGELVTGYRNYFGFPVPCKDQYNKEEDWLQVPSSYLVSDVKDMGNYLRMYLQEGGQVLSKESVKTMLSEGVPAEDGGIESEIVDAKATYMMGWIEKEMYGEKVLYHTGAVENYTSAMFLLPGKDLGISLMFNVSDSIMGQELIQKLTAGILAIGLDQKPDSIDGKSYFVKHGIVDALIVIALFCAWLPVLLMGIWKKKRKDDLWNPIGIGVDILIHIVLPTILLILFMQAVPLMWLKRFVPAMYYAALAVIGSLYFGAFVKVVAMLVYGIRKPEENTQEDGKTEKEEPEIANKKDDAKSRGDKADKSNNQEEKPEEKKTDKAENKETEKSEEKRADKTENKETEKPEEKKADKTENKETEKSEEKKADKTENKKADKPEDKKAE